MTQPIGTEVEAGSLVSIQIRVVNGSILDAEVEAIVNAANSLALMGGGVAGAIKRAAGSEVEQEARRQAPIPVGHAVRTSGGKTQYKGIIHAPTMPSPAMRIPVKNVALATRAALVAAEVCGFASIALPGMGTGVGGVEPADAAKMMIDEIHAHHAGTLRSVLLIDIDAAMVKAWERQLTREARG